MAVAPVAGSLSVVATPIGNLGDISARAVTVLRTADTVLCEDTRRTRQLLTHLGISTPTESLHAHNEHAKTAALVERCRQGAKLALVSDAGTPCLSDPGTDLVDAIQHAGIAVATIPGPFAAAAALAASGLTPIPFTFWGFVAKRSAERQRDLRRQLQTAVDGPMTHAYYVPGRDLDAVIGDLVQVAPAARVCVARELTKIHESWLRGTPAAVVQALLPQHLCGEAVLLVEISAAIAGNEPPAIDVAALVAAAKAAGEHRKSALPRLQRTTGVARTALYALWIAAEVDRPSEDSQ
ncbi:MAG: 16S rRNA (cytidine(1402)-2'-O)-methyltransferase [Myxococcales bacterium]|nr:16S rRNA (cytidine(1402)-2'-O)-methyltransferase [Myxococcales bacterium]